LTQCVFNFLKLFLVCVV